MSESLCSDGKSTKEFVDSSRQYNTTDHLFFYHPQKRHSMTRMDILYGKGEKEQHTMRRKEDKDTKSEGMLDFFFF